MLDKDECFLCPRMCGAERLSGKKGYCGADRDIMVARAAPHMWEEPCISGDRGSGAVFFSGCNLHCVYCQNKAISDGNAGKRVSVERLAEIFLELQDKKVYNINLVTPTHYTDQIRQVVLRAKAMGLNIPVVYNCGGYESVAAVESLSDCIDIWMPDFKYMSKETGMKYSNCPDYFEKASLALDEMVRQVQRKGGTLMSENESVFISDDDIPSENRESVIMKRGVIIRHMLLPGNVGESKRILRFLHERYGNDVYISIMSQYTPMPHIMSDDRYPELHKKVNRREYDRLVDFARKIGIENAFIQEEDVAEESFIPEFNGEGV